MKIEFDSDKLEDMKLIRAMLSRRIREIEEEYRKHREESLKFEKLVKADIARMTKEQGG